MSGLPKVPVSIGELIDKWNILHIKQDKVSDPGKLEDIRAEIQALSPFVTPLLGENGVKYLYTFLDFFNREIWRLQDDIRVDRSAAKCMLVIDYNDARFRVKHLLNQALTSTLKEQKNYAARKLVLITHNGTGDLITTNALVRVLCFLYDHVVLAVVHAHNMTNMRRMYGDLLGGISPRLSLIHTPQVNCPGNLSFLSSYQAQGYAVLLSGPCYNASFVNQPFFHQFYLAAGLDYQTVRFPLTYIHRDLAREKQVMAESGLVPGTYRFVHEVGSGQLPAFAGKTFQPPQAGASGSQNESLFDYGYIMENAREIHVKDSSFFCLATVLDTSKVQAKHVYMRGEIYQGYPKNGDVWVVHGPPGAPAKAPAKARAVSRHVPSAAARARTRARSVTRGLQGRFAWQRKRR